MERLPVAAIFREAGSAMTRDAGRILSRGWPAFAALVGLSVLAGRLMPDPTGAATGGSTGALLATTLGMNLLYVPMAVALHRLVLLPRDAIGTGPILLPGRADGRFLVASLRLAGKTLLWCLPLMVVPMVVVFFAIAAAGIPLTPYQSGLVGAFLSLPFSAWMLSRGGLVLPAAAVGQTPRSVRDSFALTRGNRLPMFWLIALPMAVSTAAFQVIGLVVPLRGTLGMGLHQVLVLPAVVYGVIVLSLAYARLRGVPVAEGPAPVALPGYGDDILPA